MKGRGEQLSPAWALVGLGACVLSCMLVLWPAAAWFVDLGLDRQRQIVEALTAGALAFFAGWGVVELTRRADEWWHR